MAAVMVTSAGSVTYSAPPTAAWLPSSRLSWIVTAPPTLSPPPPTVATLLRTTVRISVSARAVECTVGGLVALNYAVGERNRALEVDDGAASIAVGRAVADGALLQRERPAGVDVDRAAVVIAGCCRR
jgi:hypothetical protein